MGVEIVKHAGVIAWLVGIAALVVATAGTVPTVARPQLNTLDQVGKPRLLNAALATKVAPTNHA